MMPFRENRPVNANIDHLLLSARISFIFHEQARKTITTADNVHHELKKRNMITIRFMQSRAAKILLGGSEKYAFVRWTRASARMVSERFQLFRM